MVFVTAAIAIGAMLLGIASAAGLTSWLLCGPLTSVDQNNMTKDGDMYMYGSQVHPDDPYYFTEPVVRSETLPFLNKEAQKRHGYVMDPRT